jgi:serine/threonine protein kinase
VTPIQERRDLDGPSQDGSSSVTMQSPTWRDHTGRESSGRDQAGARPTNERATPGTVVGERYELREAIGNGGMGTVWRATDTLLRREVAVKEVLLPPTMPQSEQDALCERTMREARAAAALSHPSVVQVYDVVTDGGRPWIVMELLDARSLADMVIDDGPLAPRAVAKIGVAMLGALEVAHAAGVLHRDVKPANVLICTDGRCVLTDFGVARLPTESNLTTPGMVLGSPHFISPERAVGGAFGPPSDLFSLGVTLYTAVEGGPPFDRGDPFETMRAVVEEQPRPARLAGPLKPVLWGLLDKEPSRRWSVDQARAVLREMLSGTLSRSGHAHAQHDTDPQAIIRQPVGPPPAVRPTGPAQVGGRAMLDPNEGITGALARLQSPPEQRTPDSRRANPDRTDRTDPNGTGPVRAELDHTDPGRTDLGLTAYAEPKRWDDAPRREGVGRRRARSGGSVMAEQVADRLKAAGRDATAPANRTRTAIAVVLVLVVLVGIGVLVKGAFGGSATATPPPPGPIATVAPSPTPLIPVQEYRDRGIAVNVPKGWTRSGSGTYVDYVEPGGTNRKVRINIESSTSTAEKFLTSAETGLKKPSICPSPYTRVALAASQLGGKPSGELEYTCGTGDAKRHGIWQAVVLEGKAYTFYLTVPDARFAESKVIFDEMVRSFQFV